MSTRNAILTAITVVAALMTVTASYSISLAKEASPESREAKIKRKVSSKSAKASEVSIDLRVRKYAATYDLSKDDQEKIRNILVAQQKDIADYQKVRGAKIKAVDDQIQQLRDQIAELEKSKKEHIEVRRELGLDHEAELDAAINSEKKAARLAVYLRGEDKSSYWRYLPKETQAAMDQKCQNAAMELMASGGHKSKTAVRDAANKLRASLAASVTPEMQQAAEIQYLKESAFRSFSRYELTDQQKARIDELCAQSIKDKIAAAARYSQFVKDYQAIRTSMLKYKGSYHALTVRKEVAEKILTEEQQKRLSSKYRSSSDKPRKEKRDKKGKKGDKDKPAAKKAAVKPTL